MNHSPALAPRLWSLLLALAGGAPVAAALAGCAPAAAAPSPQAPPTAAPAGPAPPAHCPPAPAAAPPAGRTPVATVAPRPDDVGGVEGLMKAFYETVNIPPEGPRQWDRDRTLYSPHLRFVAIDGEGKVNVWDHQQFVDDTEPLVARGFREREIWRVTRRYGNMAHVDSTYETMRGPGGRDVSRGVNSIDAYFDGRRWWIASVVWQSESRRYPIPAELLPPPGKP